MKKTNTKQKKKLDPKPKTKKKASPKKKIDKPSVIEYKINQEVYVGDQLGVIASIDEKKKTCKFCFIVTGGGMKIVDVPLEKIRPKRGAGDKKITDEQLEIAIKNHKGILGAICKDYNITRSAILNRINKNEHLKEMLRDEKESFKDLIEYRFMQAVMEGHKWAIQSGIEKLLHDRGYVTKQDINQNIKQDEDQFRRSIASDGKSIMDVVKSIRETLRSDGD